MIRIKKQKIIFLSLLAVFVFLPTFSFAQDPQKQPECPDGTGYCLLEPIFADQVNKRVDMAGYLKSIYDVFFITAGILATLMLIWGGFQYMTSEIPGMKGKGKDQMQNAIWGLLLAFGSFLILNTINPGLTKINFNLRPIPNIQGGTDTTTKPTNPNPTSGVIDPAAEAAARNQLVGVAVKTECKTVGQDNCVLVMGLPQSAISGVTQLAKDCFVVGCKPYISGGTEWWGHTTHGPGKANIDLSIKNSGSTLSSYIEKNGTKLENDTRCHKDTSLPKYQYKGGIYVKENAAHWHVCY